MTGYTHLIYEVDKEKMCWLTLNRPEKFNAMIPKLIAELRSGFECADEDDSENVFVIQGSDRAFCVGYDLNEDAAEDRSSIYNYRAHSFRKFDEFITPWHITKPVIASINSIAIGKGFDLCLFCDISIASDDTRIGYNEVRHGISGHCMFLPWLVNMKIAKDLLLTDRELIAHEAKEMGLVTKIVPPVSTEGGNTQEYHADGADATRNATTAQNVF